MIDLDIRQPDISYLARYVKKYTPLIDNNKGTIDSVFSMWNELVFRKFIIVIPQELHLKVLQTNDLVLKFHEDCIRNAHLSLFTSWAIGFEFAGTYHDTAKHCLLIEDYGSQFLPPTTRTELLDLSDYGSMVISMMMVSLYKRGEFGDETLIVGLETIRKIIREGVLLVFKDGIACYFGKDCIKSN